MALNVSTLMHSHAHTENVSPLQSKNLLTEGKAFQTLDTIKILIVLSKPFKNALFPGLVLKNPYPIALPKNLMLSYMRETLYVMTRLVRCR